MIHLLKNWKQKNRYREVTSVCLPLVMGTAATTVMEFTDRIFLANYSLDAIAAAMPAGIAAFLFLAFFGGVAGYLSVFIAQYHGIGAKRRVGAVLWQGIYFSIVSGIFLAMFSVMISKPLFLMAGHPEKIQSLEVLYFNILCLGSVFHISGQALSAFFTGRGVTRPVMIITVVGMLFNIPLDYSLIYGIWIFPEMGIAGAAIATASSWALMALLFSVLIFTSKNEKRFSVLKNHQFDKEIFMRLMKYGIPGSVQFCLDILAFTFFIFIVGRIGALELTVTSIVFSISSLAFMPAMGFSMGVSTLVGQALGRGKPDEARYATFSAIHLLLFYTLIVDLLFILAPDKVLSLFMLHSSHGSAQYTVILEMGRRLLHIVAIYLFMDAMYMSFVGVLKGAGDTRFVMWSIGVAGFCFMVMPLYIGIQFFHMGLVYAWMCVLAFITSLFILSFYRYREGKWEKMLVVEKSTY
jgi:MATE family multidrug resistance protein